MTVDVTTQIVVDRPRAEVAAYASDPSRAPEWYANIRSVELKTPPPIQVGSQMEFIARFLGRELRYTYKVSEWVPGERFTMSTEQGPFPMETAYEWRDEPGGRTRMLLRNHGEPSGFASVTAPVMASAMRRANNKDLRRIKHILERRQQP